VVCGDDGGAGGGNCGRRHVCLCSVTALVWGTVCGRLAGCVCAGVRFGLVSLQRCLCILVCDLAWLTCCLLLPPPAPLTHSPHMLQPAGHAGVREQGATEVRPAPFLCCLLRVVALRLFLACIADSSQRLEDLDPLSRNGCSTGVPACAGIGCCWPSTRAARASALHNNTLYPLSRLPCSVFAHCQLPFAIAAGRFVHRRAAPAVLCFACCGIVLFVVNMPLLLPIVVACACKWLSAFPLRSG
jgi:hypothetical protein